MPDVSDTVVLDALHHVAITVRDVAEAVDWYTSRFRCRVTHQDDTWALLEFANIQVALVIPSQHPPNLSLVSEDARRFGPLKTHRDGTRSAYIKDPAGNTVEIMTLGSKSH